MKIMMVLVILVLIAAGILPMYLKGPNGQPIMTADDWKPDMQIPDAMASAVPDVVQAGGIYKWQDAEGNWHFSDEKPDDIAPEDVEDLSTGVVMTLPSEAFTGPEQTQTAPSSGGPLTVLLKHGGRGTSSAGSAASGETDGAPVDSRAALNDALSQIATQHPQFKAMSDELAARMSGAAPANP